jgi:hypothetical protein
VHGVHPRFFCSTLVSGFDLNFGPKQKECGADYAVVCFFADRRLMSDDISALVLGGKDGVEFFVTAQLGKSIIRQAGSEEQLGPTTIL